MTEDEGATRPPEDYIPKRLLSRADLTAHWEEFFEVCSKQPEIRELEQHYPEERSLTVEFTQLDAFNGVLGDNLLSNPAETLLAAIDALVKMIPARAEIKGCMDIHRRLHVRVHGLPDSPTVRVGVCNLRGEHMGKFMTVEGTVSVVKPVKPQLTAAWFECRRCGANILEAQDSIELREPMECYKDQGGCGRVLGGTKFRLLKDVSPVVDTQVVELRDVGVTTAPTTLMLWLEDDLVNSLTSSQQVLVTGIIRSKLTEISRGVKSTRLDFMLDVNSIEERG